MLLDGVMVRYVVAVIAAGVLAIGTEAQGSRVVIPGCQPECGNSEILEYGNC